MTDILSDIAITGAIFGGISGMCYGMRKAVKNNFSFSQNIVVVPLAGIAGGVMGALTGAVIGSTAPISIPLIICYNCCD